MTGEMEPDQRDRLMRLGSATLHEAMGGRGALDSAIKPLEPTRRLAGPALTVDAAPADNLVLHYALTKAHRGDVLVVDAKGFTEAGVWGDILSLAATAIGLAGLVVDGAVRDAEAIIAMGFPVFSRGLSIKATSKVRTGSVNTPVVVGGVRIAAGDIVVGDRDGLVAIPQAELEATLLAADARVEKEERLRAAINAGGTSTVELLGLEEILRARNLR